MKITRVLQKWYYRLSSLKKMQLSSKVVKSESKIIISLFPKFGLDDWHTHTYTQTHTLTHTLNVSFIADGLMVRVPLLDTSEMYLTNIWAFLRMNTSRNKAFQVSVGRHSNFPFSTWLNNLKHQLSSSAFGLSSMLLTIDPKWILSE